MKTYLPLFLAAAALAAAASCVRADSVSVNETYNEKLLNDPDFGGYYVDYTDANVVQASISFEGEVDISTFDVNTEFTVNAGDGLMVADNFLGDDPKYRTGKKSASFSYADPDSSPFSTLAYTVALSWTATGMTCKATFANYDALDLYDLLNDGPPPYLADAMDVQISFGNYSYDGVTTNFPVRDTKTRTRAADGEIFELNRATAAAYAHDPDNPYFNAQGTYLGLFIGDTNSAAPTDSGMVKFVLTDSGAYSGKVWLGGGSWPVAGQFVVQDDGSITSGAVVNRGRTLGQLGLSLALNTESFPLSISGSVSNGTAWSSDLLANQTIYDPSTAPPGAWNVGLAPADTNSADGPGGCSYGRMSLNANGALTFTMNLADGSTAPVSFAGSVAQDGSFPYYFSLDSGHAVLLGWGSFESPSAPVWVKDAVPGKFYPNGFVAEFGGIFALSGSTAITAGSYQAPQRGGNIFEATALTITLNGAGINETADFTYNPARNSFAFADGVNSQRFALSVNLQTGVFSGSFNSPAGKIAFSGEYLPEEGEGYGYFKNGSQTGVVYLTTPPPSVGAVAH